MHLRLAVWTFDACGTKEPLSPDAGETQHIPCFTGLRAGLAQLQQLGLLQFWLHLQSHRF